MFYNKYVYLSSLRVSGLRKDDFFPKVGTHKDNLTDRVFCQTLIPIRFYADEGRMVSDRNYNRFISILSDIMAKYGFED